MNLKKIAVIGVLVIIVTWVLSGLVLFITIDTWPNRGTFGDMFGAVNSQFSVLWACISWSYCCYCSPDAGTKFMRLMIIKMAGLRKLATPLTAVQGQYLTALNLSKQNLLNNHRPINSS